MPTFRYQIYKEIISRKGEIITHQSKGKYRKILCKYASVLLKHTTNISEDLLSTSYLGQYNEGNQEYLGLIYDIAVQDLGSAHLDYFPFAVSHRCLWYRKMSIEKSDALFIEYAYRFYPD